MPSGERDRPASSLGTGWRGRARAWTDPSLTFSGFLTEYYIGTEAPYYFGQEVRAYRVQDGKVPVYRESPTGFSKLDD